MVCIQSVRVGLEIPASQFYIFYHILYTSRALFFSANAKKDSDEKKRRSLPHILNLCGRDRRGANWRAQAPEKSFDSSLLFWRFF